MKNIFLTVLLCLSLHNSLGNIIKPQKIKICVIGAGPSGIIVTRHLADNLDKFDITVFEKTSEIGGQWVYRDETGLDKYGYPIDSSIYINMRTNAPKEVMNFADLPDYRKGVNTSSVKHSIVLEYLRNYADHFDIEKFIQFTTIVENVTLQKIDGVDKWKITVKNLETSKRRDFVFDVVVVCNGQLFSPYIPVIPGLENFKGKVLHGHVYRKPDEFRNKSIIVLGAGSSGLDIGKELNSVASKVYISHNHEKMPVSLHQVAGIDRFENGEFVLKDNSTISADVLLYCTGYNYEYPFLDNTSGITIDDNYITPLYKHTINIEHPSMCFMGIPQGYANLPRFYSQAQFITSYLSGNFQLPPKEVMLEDSKLKAEKKRKAHELPDSWSYNDDLADLGRFKPLPRYYKMGQDAWVENWLMHYDDYKDYNLVINDDKKSVKIVKQGIS